MAQPSYPARSAYSGRLPERTIPSSSQPQFGQSAPGFGRQPQYPPQPQQQPAYSAYAQHGTNAALGAGRAQMHGQLGSVGLTMERENNILNDLSDEQRDEITEAFSIFDLDKDRHLDFHEMRVAFKALGFDITKEEGAQLIRTYGGPKPNIQSISPAGRAQTDLHPSQMLISQNTFTRLAAQKMIDRDPREEVDRAFYLFDAAHKDYIDIDDLRRVARELGETSLEEHELQTMIDEFDYEGRGGISKEAFFSICLQ